MTDLSREQIEKLRAATLSQSSSPRERAGIGALFDMALRTHDAEADRDNYRAKFHDVETRAQRAEAECERLRESVKFTEDWYATRWARLRDLVKESAPDLWPDVASVMANGTASPSEPPTYAQRLNYYRHRAEKAERALATPPPEKPQAPTIEELHEERKRWRPDAPQTPEQTECASCGEGMPRDECPESKRPCGHHCNHSWTQDICHWCGKEFGEETDEPEQAHGDALAVVERIEGNLCGPSGRLNEPVAHIFKSDLDCIRQALTASGVPEDNND